MQSKIKEKLLVGVLSKRSLPIKPESIELYGKYIKLLPLDITRDSEELFIVSNGQAIQRKNKSIEEYDSNERIWKYLSDGPFTHINDLINSLEGKRDSFDLRLFCVFDAIENYQIGIALYRDSSSTNLTIEIGLWLSPIAQGTKAATEICYLLIGHAFSIGYRRIQWVVTQQNIRSFNLAIKVGFAVEFLKQKYFIMKNKEWNVFFLRILDFEWPTKKQQLEDILYNNH